MNSSSQCEQEEHNQERLARVPVVVNPENEGPSEKCTRTDLQSIREYESMAKREHDSQYRTKCELHRTITITVKGTKC